MSDTTAPVAIRHDSSVDIGLPLRAEHAATLRVLVTTLGVDGGFSVDEIDDVKLAVSEVFTSLADGADDDARAEIIVSSDVGSITVELRRSGSDAKIELDALATTILSSVVDDFTVTGSSVLLVKRSSETSR